MTNRKMAEKMMQMANELSDMLAKAYGEQYAPIYEAGEQILKSIEDLGFKLGEDFGNDGYGNIIWY